MGKAGLALLLVLSIAGEAGAARLLSGQEPFLPREQVVEDDLYAAGGRVRIAGTVAGDLVVAGGEILVEGEVKGDLVAAGGEITVRGPVGGTIRAAGGNLRIEGPVAEDAVVAAGRLRIEGAIGRDLLASGGEMEVTAPIARNASAGGGRLRVEADVGGDLEAMVGALELGPVRVGGDLRLPEGAEDAIDPGARIGGTLIRTERREHEPSPGGRVFSFVRLFVGLYALGALFALAAPTWSAEATGVPLETPGAAAVAGLAVLVGVPLATLLVSVLGLLVGGWWIGLVLMALYAIALVLSLPLSAQALGRLLARQIGREGWRWPLLLPIGLAILVLLLSIPFVGGLVALAAILFGLGGLALPLRRHRLFAPASPPG